MSDITNSVVTEETPFVEVTDETANVPFTETSQEQETPPAPLGTLFDSISYAHNEDVPMWLEKMNVNDAVFALISAAAYGHKKGLYNLLESEIVSKAIRLITLKKPESENNPPVAQ